MGREGKGDNRKPFSARFLFHMVSLIILTYGQLLLTKVLFSLVLIDSVVISTLWDLRWSHLHWFYTSVTPLTSIPTSLGLLLVYTGVHAISIGASICVSSELYIDQLKQCCVCWPSEVFIGLSGGTSYTDIRIQYHWGQKGSELVIMISSVDHMFKSRIVVTKCYHLMAIWLLILNEFCS